MRSLAAAASLVATLMPTGMLAQKGEEQTSQSYYAVHHPPRVFVYHRPLRVLGSGPVEILVEPELESGVVVRSVVAFLRVGGLFEQEQTCQALPTPPLAPGPTRYVCTFKLNPTSGRATYRAEIRTKAETVRSRTSYTFGFGELTGPMVLLRVPTLPSGIPAAKGYRLSTLFARDETEPYSEAEFAADVERALYEEVLSDPVYRWRDDQLSFYAATDTAFTRGYYSPRATRCGQRPWKKWRPEYETVDVVGVLHRQGSPSGALEVRDPSGFRDCSGAAIDHPKITTFSARGDKSYVVMHEFGHAAFRMGDEYAESDATALVEGEDPASRGDCCCLVPPKDPADPGDSSGQAKPPGGAGVPPTGREKTCYEPRAETTSAATQAEVATLESCDEFVPAPDCQDDTLTMDLCPVKAPSCNRFQSLLDCQQAQSAAANHPGVERAAQGLGSCRRLCGGPAAPCACSAPAVEAWIVDLNPAGRGDDVMAGGPAATLDHGSTCAVCVEDELCRRKLTALGKSGSLQATVDCDAS